MRVFDLSRIRRPSQCLKCFPSLGRLRSLALLCTFIQMIATSAGSIADVRVIEIRSSTDLSGRKSAPTSTKVIQVHGAISPADLPALEKLFPTVRNFAISLNSRGGDVATAMAIGRLLRRAEKFAVVRAQDSCVSACVFILAGATHRIIEGKVGIHRPFVGQDGAMTAEQQKAQYNAIERLVKAYLGEMNVDLRLYDDMFRISPGSVRYLSSKELQSYGLDGTDPYVEQSQIARRAKELRITTQELLQRQAEAEVKCKNSKIGFGKCYLAIEIGISDQEYARRERVAYATCAGQLSRVEQMGCRDRIIDGLDK